MAEKIIVGMSGGVDSSLSAWLLLQQGYEVEGLFMFNWTEDEDGYCNAADDYQNALTVCAELGIPLHKADFSDAYRQRVFRYFLSEYAAGRTPNPDVLCNREIKFKSFLDYAQRLGASRIATGHYAGLRKIDGQIRLVKARDANKDQTYFLALVPQAAFERSLFPLTDYSKPEVRELAARAGLPNHARKDSTGICFIGERPMRQFLGDYLKAEPGPIRSLDHAGRELGQHRGLIFHTLGQRRGLGLGGLADGEDAPWFVVRKDLGSNTLWVSQNDTHPELFSHELELEPMHWIGPEAPLPLECTARIRHRQSEQSCRVDVGRKNLRIHFDAPQRAVAPGQYAVLYAGDICLGGARIEQTCRGGAI